MKPPNLTVNTTWEDIVRDKYLYGASEIIDYADELIEETRLEVSEYERYVQQTQYDNMEDIVNQLKEYEELVGEEKLEVLREMKDAIRERRLPS